MYLPCFDLQFQPQLRTVIMFRGLGIAPQQRTIDDPLRLLPGKRQAKMAGGRRQPFSRCRQEAVEIETLAGRDPPAWVYLHGMTSKQSSSAIRARRRAATPSRRRIRR